MKLFMPLDFLVRIVVIRNLIRLTRLVLCAQRRPMSAVGVIGYGDGVPCIWSEWSTGLSTVHFTPLAGDAVCAWRIKVQVFGGTEQEDAETGK